MLARAAVKSFWLQITHGGLTVLSRHDKPSSQTIASNSTGPWSILEHPERGGHRHQRK